MHSLSSIHSGRKFIELTESSTALAVSPAAYASRQSVYSLSHCVWLAYMCVTGWLIHPFPVPSMAARIWRLSMICFLSLFPSRQTAVLKGDLYGTNTCISFFFCKYKFLVANLQEEYAKKEEWPHGCPLFLLVHMKWVF